MLLLRRLSVLCLIGFLMVSCSKEMSSEPNYRPPAGGGGGGGASTGLKGNWQFLFMDARTRSIVVSIEPGSPVLKTDTYTNYVTTDNKGVLTLDGSKAISTDLGYSVSTVAKSYLYEDAILFDSLDIPFIFTIPPSSNTMGYKTIGADSIYFEGGGLLTAPGGGSVSSKPGGFKYKISGDTLTLFISTSETKTQTFPGFPGASQTQTSWVTAEVNYKRK